MMEATDFSLNRQFYGNMHNLLHVAVAFLHDPDHRHLERSGVVGESMTAMRDPVFYRIHALVNDIFNQHKFTLPRYTVPQVLSFLLNTSAEKIQIAIYYAQLNFPGVRVTGIELSTPNAPTNTFQTFWQKSLVDLSRGVDFFERGPIFAKFTHLNHNDFSIRINVNIKTVELKTVFR
jgi:Hemocyanin, ig-like domain/Hemocyanin, copper containing domain